MKANFIILLCLVTISLSAQVNTTTNTTNSSPQEENTIETKEEESIKDSIIFEAIPLKKMESKPSTKTVEKATKSKELNQNFDQKSTSFKHIKLDASSQTNQRTPTSTQQKQMDELVEYYHVAAPKSFEYYYFKYTSSNYNTSLISYLEEARKLKPNNVDVSVQFAAYHFIEGNKLELKKEIEFLFKNGKIEKEVCNYAEDLLNSIVENGTLITHGFDDTYSLIYLQEVKNIRPDVEIISLDFMQSETYRNKLIARNFQMPKSNIIDVNYFESFCHLNSTKKIQVSLTIPKAYLSKIQSELSILGLSFILDKSLTNLNDLNVNFYEKSIKTNRLIKYETDKCKKLSSNYLPVLFSLRNYYLNLNSTKEINEIDTYIEKVGVQTNINVNSLK